QGFTTAAVIWSMAGIGMMIGFKSYTLGVFLTNCMVIVLSFYHKIENLMSHIYFLRIIVVTFQHNEAAHLGTFENFMKEYKIKPQRKGVEKKGDHLTVVYEITGSQKNIRRANDAIIALDYVYSFNNLG